MITTINSLLALLTTYGGEIVSTKGTDQIWIDQAKASGRYYEDGFSNSFIWEPPIYKFPENEEEIDFMDKWFPLQIPLPEEISNPEIFFAIIKKRMLEKKQIKEN